MSDKLTYAEIGAHLDLSVQRVAVLLREEEIDNAAAIGLDGIRVRYIRRLRAEAGRQRGGDGQGDLVRARIETERITAQLKELELMERLGEVMPTALATQLWQTAIVQARTELYALAEGLENELRAADGSVIEPGSIRARVDHALDRLSDAAGECVDGVADGDQALAGAA